MHPQFTPSPRSGWPSRIDARGYVWIKIPERGWVAEHRWIMEQYLGRRLLATEVVHHCNGDKADNDRGNLEIVERAAHLRLEFRRVRYGPGTSRQRHAAPAWLDQQTTTASSEQWRPLPGYEGWYSVSNLGRVRRDRPGRGTRIGRIQVPHKNREGYLFVCMSQYGKNRRHAVHLLVAAAFLGPVPDGCEVDHKDGDPTNNRADNLEYVSHIENLARAVQRRIQKTGSPSPNTHLTADDVRAIRASTASGNALGKRYGMHGDAINLIRRGKRWKHLPLS